jgi:hypothetical protein
MLSTQFINSELGYVLNKMGFPVCNAALWKQELGENAPTEQEILDKKAELDAIKEEQAEALDLEKQKEAQYSAWVAQGFDTGLGYKLRVSDSDQNKYANLVTGNLLENTPESTVFDIEALDDTKIKLTWGELKPILIAYKNYCYSSWKAGKGIA